MKIKVHYENEELDKLVKDEETRELIIQTLILYPVTWEIIRDMICQGLNQSNVWYVVYKRTANKYSMEKHKNSIRSY